MIVVVATLVVSIAAKAIVATKVKRPQCYQKKIRLTAMKNMQEMKIA